MKTQERERLLECTHSLVNLCHYTYETKFKNQREENCEENFEKICSITFKQQAVNETLEKCYVPIVKECSDEENHNSEVICKTVFESECNTKYVEKQPGKFVSETTCSKIPKELCGSNSCKFTPGPEECHNKTVFSLADVPDEICDLIPKKTCHGAIKLVPYLSPQHECKDVPREVCSFGVKGTILGEKPIVTRWCFNPVDEEAGALDISVSPSKSRPGSSFGTSNSEKNSLPPNSVNVNPQQAVSYSPTESGISISSLGGETSNENSNGGTPIRSDNDEGSNFSDNLGPTDGNRLGSSSKFQEITSGNGISAGEVINTFGPNPAPIASDVFYEYDSKEMNFVSLDSKSEDYSVPFLEETQPSTGIFTPLTTPATTPRSELKGTTSADIVTSYKSVTRGGRTKEGSKEQPVQHGRTSYEDYYYYYYDEGDYPEALFHTTISEKDLSKRTTKNFGGTTPSPGSFSNSLSLVNSQRRPLGSTSSVANLKHEIDFKFHKFVPNDLKTIVDLVNENAKKNLKFAQANGSLASKKAEKTALAKVIQHNDRNSEVDKTVIVKNTPEAVSVFGIKNIPKELFFTKQRHFNTMEDIRNHNESSGATVSENINLVSKGGNDVGQSKSNKKNTSKANTINKTNVIEVSKLRGSDDPTSTFLDHIFIEEVATTDSKETATTNPFLSSQKPLSSQVLIKGRPSWDIQPVSISPKPRPIITLPLSGQINPKPFPTSGGINFPKQKNIPQNSAVNKAQSFAIPDKPSGPNKFEKFKKLQQTGLRNTIKNHHALIHPSQVNTSRPLFDNNPSKFPTNITEVLSDERIRTSRNPKNTFDPRVQVTKGAFSPPTTLQYGFKPLSTPSLLYSTTQLDSAALSTGGQFSPPNTLMFGFSPLSTATQRPSTYVPGAQARYTPSPPVSKQSNHHSQLTSQPLESFGSGPFQNPSGTRKSRSMMDFIQDFFKPITKPLQQMMSK